jgi:hypothetical protein
MKKSTKAEDVYYRSMGCGCCTDSDAPEWPDVEKAMREEIAQEIEAIEINELNVVGMKDLAVKVARGQTIGIKQE